MRFQKDIEHLQITQQKTVDQTAQNREEKESKAKWQRLKNRIFSPFLPFGIAIEALSHCDKASFALR
jgi:hypothetical protein